jgi:Cysteine-rich secretory protein family
MTPDLPKTEMAILEMTNAFRKENALGVLKTDAKLAAAARAYARYLADSGKFAHEADGQKPAQRAEAAGYKFCFIAENLAMDANSRGFSTRGLAEEAMSGWKKSPVHRANLLRTGMTDIGIGVAKAPDHAGKYIAVQMFGLPESQRMAFSIENMTGSAIEYRLSGKPHALSPGKTITYRSCGSMPLNFPAATRVEYQPVNGERFIVRTQGGDKLVVDRK